ncbi:hypothetical protein GQX73_g3397 [Xylaria multiplex]|uniref:Uncharacterized protein n=1 Tax=Xylaria multiplex TaxID=323545 RepID=A0A7C8N7G7_9PEZI|nr:hypothetical protein GQX73_g3397 [Xylaria multiplex]
MCYQTVDAKHGEAHQKLEELHTKKKPEISRASDYLFHGPPCSFIKKGPGGTHGTTTPPCGRRECGWGAGVLLEPFWELAIDQPEGGVVAKSTQPIGLLFGPGSSESGRDIDTCRIAAHK